MKKFGLLIFAAAIIIGVVFSSFFSFGRLNWKMLEASLGRSVTGSGTVTAEKRSVRAFNSIEVAGVFRVEVTNQRAFGLEVEADDNLLQYIKTEVEGDVLKIESEKRLNSASPIRIRVSAPNVEIIEAGGAAKVEVAGVNNDLLDIDASGKSSVKAAGETARFNAQVSGGASIDAGNLKSVDADVDASGAGRALVNVTGILQTDASGAGRITYTGSPASVNRSVSGAGTVEQK